MEVSLGMYPIPGLEEASQAWVSGLARHGSDVAPGVELGQTCGLPLVIHHQADTRVVAIPRYRVRGCYGHR